MTNKLIALAFASQMAFAQGLSKKCVNELMAIPERKNFDMQDFLKELPIEVAKVKAQQKLPFGKPADSKITDIGMTVGCLKAFPENPGQIQALLKDVGLETAKNVAANKLGTTARAGIASSADAGSDPSLKKCDAIFNPSKKFCYDGEVYDLCDGMSYNPTTHICSGDIASRALCNGVQYNPLKQKCENNALFAVCGGIPYNVKTHGCKDNAVFARCGTAFYDPSTQICRDNTVLARCGEAIYDPATHGCKDNTVLSRCGAAFYDPSTQTCRDNTVLSRCGATFYDPSTQVCKDNTVLARCGATEFYNPKTHECRFHAVVAK